MNTDSKWSKQEACFARENQLWLAVFTSPVSLLANNFDIQSVLRVQASLAAVIYIYFFNEVMNSCKNLKIHQRLVLKM